MLLSKERFHQFIQALRTEDKKENELRALGVDLHCNECEWTNPFVDLIEEMCFNKAQRDTLGWWLYDCPKGVSGDPTPNSFAVITYPKENKQWDLTTVDELYEYLLTEAEV